MLAGFLENLDLPVPAGRADWLAIGSRCHLARGWKRARCQEQGQQSPAADVGGDVVLARRSWLGAGFTDRFEPWRWAEMRVIMEW